MMGLDDRILEHPKFIRLVCECGSDGLFLWLALRAHCGQHLTNGRVPKDIVPELRGPKSKRVRENCLAVMLRVRLLHDLGDEWEMHDYLDWADSREKVLEKRRKWRERQGLSRASKRDSTTDSSEESRCDTPETLQRLSEESRRSSSSASSSSSSERLSNLQRGPKDLSGQSPPEPPLDTHAQGSEAVQSQTRRPPGHVVAFERSFWPTVETWAGPTAEHQRYAREHGLTLDFERTKYTSNRKKNAYQCANFDADFQEWLAGSAERLRARRRTNGSAEPTLSEDRITASQARILAKIRRENHG